MLLELGTASVDPSPLPPIEPTPGIAEIEGFPISDRPGAIRDLFSAGEPSALGATPATPTGLSARPAPSMPPIPETGTVQGLPSLRPGRTTLPFGVPGLEATRGAAPPLSVPVIAARGDSRVAAPRALTGPPPLMVPPELVAHREVAAPVPVPPAAASPPGFGAFPEAPAPHDWAAPVPGIRWGLVLSIVLVLGGIAAVVIGLEVAKRGPVAAAPSESAAGASTRAPLHAPQGQELDDAGFDALRAQVHAFGAVESPALQALLDAEAGALRHAATPTCAAGSVGCLLSPSGGERSHYRPLGETPRGEEGKTGPWLANLRLPGIGVAGDRRVRALFEFHTEHAVGREIFQGTLFQCGAYQALIHEVLIQHDVPLDLTALAMVASGCVADVESPTGARGLWQVSPLTARAYDLQIIPGVIDERLDPMKSTAAAVRFLADLRQKTGSWELAAAGFGVGPFELLARLVRAGAPSDLWSLASDPLLGETAGFVAKVQAYALILSNLDRYHFQDPPVRPVEVTETVEVPAGTRLGLVARAAGTSTTRIRELNPELLGSSVPTEPAPSFVIRVPQSGAQRARDGLPALISKADGAEQCVPHHFDWGRQRFTRNMAHRCQKASL